MDIGKVIKEGERVPEMPDWQSQPTRREREPSRQPAAPVKAPEKVPV